uniref:RUN and SH3 domain containing 2 n=1 Tax=Iconisemion striatum TaxID=60296 RepID=A0A1A7WZ04_9TELE
MIGASSSLSGDTLIACHFPVVQLPTWQLPVQTLCSSAKRPGRLCSVGLTRAASLPEQNTLSREHAFAGGRRHFSSSYGSLNEDRGEEEGTSDSSGRDDSTSSPEETSSHLRKENTQLRSHNSFLPNAELEEDEDSDGDNLHRYHEDSSFVLHGMSNWSLGNGDVNYTLPGGDVDSEWGNEGMMLGMEREQDVQMDSLLPVCQFHVSRSGASWTSCLEQGSVRLHENTSRCIYSQHRCSPEPLPNSDSSCNSSDGVLVNFCTIYDKSNNPATPHDLSSPALHPDPSSEGSVFLSLQPVPQSPARVDMAVHSPPQDADKTLSGSHWSSQGLDSNCNLYSLEPLPPGLSSLEVSDLAACLQGQASLTMETNQKYYKLVTCDLSSQSPSPAWSSLTSCPLEGQGTSSPFLPPVDSKKEEQPSEVTKACDHQVATSSTDKTLGWRQQTDSVQILTHSPILCSPQSRRRREAGAKSTQPSGSKKHHHHDAEDRAPSSFHREGVCYNKPQRPTSLPIQPFVLLPTGKPQHLGGLLEQYMSHKSSKPGSSQNGLKFNEKSSQRLSDLHSSSTGSNCPIFLEAPSSSDTCSTCTPSPQCPIRRHTWSQFNKNHGSPNISEPSLNPQNLKATTLMLNKESSNGGKTNSFSNFISTHNQSKLVKIPTYQDPINLPSESKSPNESTINPAYHLPNPSGPRSPPKTKPHLKLHHAAPAADSGFFHSSVKAAFTAVAPLSSLSSFLSSATSGLHPQIVQGTAGLSSKPHQSQSLILSDRPPAEFCLSPDTSYESMSISHLQRKGLLRSVSNAVDLIMAHFGCSRDPDEKMRLGNSSYSPTISGLVLEHLCPAIQNILEDGLRDHKLDFIIGQRRNHSWNVVEISTRVGPSVRVLQSLVAKIKHCPELTSHCMRLRAFLMGLLNLRSLEFWLNHLQSQTDVVTAYYHSWGFLFVSLGRCQPLFQELLLLLQPLSVLPFDLNLLLEPRLLGHRQLEQGAFPPQPCSALLVTSWPKLQADRKLDSSDESHLKVSHNQELLGSHRSSCYKQQHGSRSPLVASIPEFSPNKPDPVERGVQEVEISQNHADIWFQISMDGKKDETREEKDWETQNTLTPVQLEESSLRWAKLFRAEKSSPHPTGTHAKRNKLPSQWFHLDRLQLGILAQSIRSFKLGGAQIHKNC